MEVKILCLIQFSFSSTNCPQLYLVQMWIIWYRPHLCPAMIFSSRGHHHRCPTVVPLKSTVSSSFSSVIVIGNHLHHHYRCPLSSPNPSSPPLFPSVTDSHHHHHGCPLQTILKSIMSSYFSSIMGPLHNPSSNPSSSEMTLINP